VAGVVGRESGEIRLEVVASAGAEELDEFVDRSCLSQYVAMFQWGHNIKEVSDEFIQVMLGIGPYTNSAS
jgi:hypothetical protein